jgi:hypothetical protein
MHFAQYLVASRFLLLAIANPIPHKALTPMAPHAWGWVHGQQQRVQERARDKGLLRLC